MQKISSVDDSWKKIISWFERNAPSARAAELIQPPVSNDELKRFRDQIGVVFPEDFNEFYAVMNGTDPNGDDLGIFPSEDSWDEMAFGPMSLDHIVRHWSGQNMLLAGGDFKDISGTPREPETCDSGVLKEWWNPGWIPFANNGGGDYFCIDTVPAPSGCVGQVITHSHETGGHKILAPSLSAFLAKLSQRLESEELCYDEDYGLKLADTNED